MSLRVPVAAVFLTLTVPALAGANGPDLRPAIVPAGAKSLLPAPDLDAYVAARRALAQGEPGRVLAHLEDQDGGLLSDRVALTRADALLALGEIGPADRAYRDALDQARVPEVAIAAARGRFETLRQLGRAREAERVLDRLLERSPSAALRLAKIRLLDARGARQKAHAEATSLARQVPWTADGRTAARLARQLESKGVKPEPLTPARRLDLAEKMIEARRPEHAARWLEDAPAGPRRRLVEAHLHALRGDAEAASAAYLALGGPEVPARIAAEALWRVGRMKLRADDNQAAQVHFDALVKRAPGTWQARKAAYLAGWISYDDGQYVDARNRMLRYARTHPRARDRDEALWYAAWASYLGRSFEAAQSDLRQLIREHPRSSLVPQAYYWLGRVSGRSGDDEAAKTAFRRVLALDPLGYYGIWAERRLASMGVPLPTLRPPKLGPVSVSEALAALGSGRPVNLDRAIHLHEAGRIGEAAEEIAAARRHLERGDRATRAKISQLLHGLGVHYLAFRTAVPVIGSGGDLSKGDPSTWRAWRGAYPRAFEAEVTAAHRTHRVEPEMVWAVMRTESHYRPWVRSPVGARGLMQLMPATARRIGQVAEGGRSHASRYQRPASNIWLGSWYLSELLRRYEGQLVAAVGAYNGGPAAMDRWLEAFDGMALDEFVERVPYRETRRYIRRVIETWSIYQRIYHGRRPELPERIARVVREDAKASF